MNTAIESARSRAHRVLARSQVGRQAASTRASELEAVAEAYTKALNQSLPQLAAAVEHPTSDSPDEIQAAQTNYLRAVDDSYRCSGAFARARRQQTLLE